jgi:hypothetical protein
MATGTDTRRSSPPFQKLYVYQTRSRVYVVANLSAGSKCRVLKLSRQDAASLEAVEDPSDYTAEECNSLLRRIHEGNANHGGLQLVCEVGAGPPGAQSSRLH